MVRVVEAVEVREVKGEGVEEVLLPWWLEGLAGPVVREVVRSSPYLRRYIEWALS